MKEYMTHIVGNSSLREKLCKDILSDRLSHAIILEGKLGTGKHTVALHTAAALACERKNDPNAALPCAECPSCKKILDGKSPDIITVSIPEDKKTIGVDIIRHYRTDTRTVPNDLDFKLYVIEDADKMTEAAQNALLLTLEEPPSFVRFILLCEDAKLLLETIRSRAQILNTRSVTHEELDLFLSSDRKAAQMKLSSPEDYKELIVSAKGSIGTAMSLLHSQKFETVKGHRDFAQGFVELALDGASAQAIISSLPKFSQRRDILEIQLLCISDVLRDLILLKKSESAPLCFFYDRDRAIEMCEKASLKFLYDLNTTIINAIDSLQISSNISITLIKIFTDANLI